MDHNLKHIRCSNAGSKCIQCTCKMASPPCCFIHFEGEYGPLTRFSSVSYQKFKKCHEQWINLDGQQRLVAEKTLGVLQVIEKGQENTDVNDLYYHRACYSKFTNLTNIKRSQARCTKIEENRSHGYEYEKDESIPSSPPRKKTVEIFNLFLRQ